MKFHDYQGSLLKSKVLIVSALTSLLQVSQNDIAGPSQSAPPFSGLVRKKKKFKGAQQLLLDHISVSAFQLR